MEILYQGDWLRLCRRETFEFVQRVRSRAAAIIIAVTPESKLLLVEQYRRSLDANVLELPAGLVGDEAAYAGESITDAAIRELLEETGYEAAQMQEVAIGPISSGLSSELMTFCYADGLQKRHAGGGVEGENITVHEVPLAEIEHYLEKAKSRGLFIDPKIYIGLYFVSRFYNKL